MSFCIVAVLLTCIHSCVVVEVHWKREVAELCVGGISDCNNYFDLHDPRL